MDSIEASLLRPLLYRKLRQVFNEVKVGNAGIEASPPDGRLLTLPAKDGHPPRKRRGFDRRLNDSPGEEFRICCPFCGDGYFRLSINHLWGADDLVTADKNLHLAYCYNEGCLNGFDRQQALYDMVFVQGSPYRNVMNKGAAAAAADTVVAWPGRVWPLQAMPDLHPAVMYLRKRSFEPRWLGVNLGVGFLTEPKPEYVAYGNRIFIPVFMSGELAGWQVRDPFDGGSYLTCPAMHRSKVLYNFDRAKAYEHCVIVEGVTDVWRFGPEAVAVLGKPTQYQISLAARVWPRVFVALDGDALAESRKIFSQLRGLNCQAKFAEFPDDKDPADYLDVDELRSLVFDRSKAA